MGGLDRTRTAFRLGCGGHNAATVAGQVREAMSEQSRREEAATRLMTTGGDARIRLDPATGLNRYFSAPRPSQALAYASSTANDISAEAFAHASGLLGEIGKALSPAAYRERLEALRGRIRRAYGVPDEVEIVFAPSGTDLEYVALACAAGKSEAGIHNILLGADEVGSGCIHSAHGRYFAESTALGIETRAGDPVPGLGETHVEMIDIPVRDEQGRPRPSAEIAARMDEAIRSAKAAGRHALVHVVHGSKTGLILPSLGDIDRLRGQYGESIGFVVDACQARITSPAIADYLARGAIVFVTGSKFMGGPPFSGFALVPAAMARDAAALPEGFATVFRRAEWPSGWPGAQILPDTSNIGLLLRFEASLFELERFQALPLEQVSRVILAFHAAVRSGIIETTPARRVAPYPPGDRLEADTHPIEMRTLSTLDLSGFGGGGASFGDAGRWHKAMVGQGVRLGQPVKCVKLLDGSWGATLRIGLAMPQVTERAGLSDEALARSFEADMERVRDALEKVTD
jgi:selenocysteine lyase/cysteine desulfurase